MRKGLIHVVGLPMLKNVAYQQNWRKNMITFRRGKAKVRVPTHPRSSTGKELRTLYAECINMLQGFANEEVDQYLEENPKIVPLFEINVAEAVSPYITQSNDVGEDRIKKLSENYGKDRKL